MKALIFTLCLISTYSFSQQKELGWLLGTWQEEGKQAFEVWKADNGIMTAESYRIKDGNKSVTEEIKLIKKGNDFYYVPDVVGPQGPVEFKITSFDKNSFIAENPEHDFPRKIKYEKVDDTHLKASISGGTKTISYSFNKIK